MSLHGHFAALNRIGNGISRAAALLLLGLLLGSTVHGAPLVDQPMTGPTAPGWYLGPAGTPAILTGNGAIDPNGDGWLRLTSNTGNQAGYGFFNTAFDIRQGVVIQFDYATWGGTGADGYSVFLFDGAITPATFQVGASGGSLGYAPKTVAPISPGLSGGYLGIGIDEFGNFSAATEGRTGGPGARPQSVAVRGPAASNYAYIGGTPANIGQLWFNQGARPTQTGIQYRKVIIQLTPVPAPNHLRIDVFLQFGAGQPYTQVLNGLMVNQAPPASVKIGYAASTGGSTNYHEIRNLIVDPLSTAINLKMTKSASLASIALGSALTYTVTARNEGPSNITASTVPIVDNIPAQLTGVTWSCSGAGGGSCGAAAGSGNSLNTSATLPFNGSVTYTINGTLTAPPGASLTNTASLIVPAGIADIRPSDNSATVNVTYAGAGGTNVAVSGVVYNDANLNNARDGGEASPNIAGIYAKLCLPDRSTCPQRVAVAQASGAFTFPTVPANNTYTLILSTTNTAAFDPSFPSAQWTFVNPVNFILDNVAVGAANLTNQDLGVFQGTRLAGRVFNDTGEGGGTTNNGTQDGSEVGLYNVAVGVCNNTANCTGNTNTIANTLTNTNGDYVLYIPWGNAFTAGVARIAQNIPAGSLMVNYNPGNTTGSAVSTANGYTTFTFARGTNASGVLLADVPQNGFAPNNSRTGAPGSTVYFPHTFTPGSGGSVSFAVNSRTQAGWPAVAFYQDVNCSGSYDGGDTLIAGALTATEGIPICMLTAEPIAAGAANGATDTIVTRATFTFTNSAGPVTTTHDVTDTATVIASDLSTSSKSWSDANGGDQNPGDIIQYTITLNETAGGTTTGVAVTDNIPANVTNFSVVSFPAGAINNSTPAGGSNGTGYLDITGISVPGGGTATIVFNVTIAGGTTAGTLINNSAMVTNPSGSGGTATAPTLTVSSSAIPASGNKPLYLYDSASTPARKLSRTPMAVTPGSFVAIPRGNTTLVWTLNPAPHSAITITSGNIPVQLWLSTDSSRTYSIPVTLRCGGTNVATVTQNTALTNGAAAALFTFNLPLAADYTCNPPNSWALAITNTEGAGVGRNIRVYPAPAVNSYSNIRLPSQNVININNSDIAYYDAGYLSGGNLLGSVNAGNTVYIRAIINDPFGSYDISGASVSLTDASGTVKLSGAAMTEVNDSLAASKTYEYAYTIPAGGPAGNWQVQIDAVEGMEGTVNDYAVASLPVTVPQPSLLAVKNANGATAAAPGDTVTYKITLTNAGVGVAANVVINDRVGSFTALKMDAFGAGKPFAFADGAIPSGYTDVGPVVYSQDNGLDGYSYVPPATGLDPTITNWKMTMPGPMNGGGASFTLTYVQTVR